MTTVLRVDALLHASKRKFFMRFRLSFSYLLRPIKGTYFLWHRLQKYFLLGHIDNSLDIIM